MGKVMRILGCLTLLALVFARLTPATVQAASDCDLSQGALIGTLAQGINCVDGDGLHDFQLKSSVLDVTSLDDVAVCGDNILVLHIFGISSYDGSNWSDFEVPSEVFAPNALACASADDVWIAHTSGVSHYVGGEWTTFEDDKFGTSPFIIGVDDIAVGADESVWAATSNSIARYNDGEWQVFENGSGWDQDYSLGGFVLNSDGLPTAVYSEGLLVFDGDEWNELEKAPITGLQGIAVDLDGRIWVGSISSGVAVYDDDGWEVYNTDNGLSSNSIHSLATDGQGRVWVGTGWGLSVLDGDEWTVYQMGNSDLLDNNVQFVDVFGDGPDLPETEEKETGSIIGVVEAGRDSVPNADVELCTESVGGVFYGDSPCEGQPGEMLATTNDDGEFIFEDVPAGRYDVVINGPDGWIYFIGADKVVVTPGEETDLDDIDVSN